MEARLLARTKCVREPLRPCVLPTRTHPPAPPLVAHSRPSRLIFPPGKERRKHSDAAGAAHPYERAPAAAAPSDAGEPGFTVSIFNVGTTTGQDIVQQLRSWGAKFKTSRKVATKPNKAFVSVRTQEEADSIVAACDGKQVDGIALSTRIAVDSARPATAGAAAATGSPAGAAASSTEPPLDETSYAALQNFVFARFNADTRVLTLDNLAGQGELQGLGLNVSRSSACAAALIDVISMHASTLQTLALTNNGLTTCLHLRGLGQAAPALRNLSLAGNHIRRIEDLKPLSGGLAALMSLDLTGNALASSPSYRADVLSVFPSLESLDGVAFTPVVQFGVPKSLLRGMRLPVAASHRPDSVAAFVDPFIARFFELFDDATERTSLIHAYSPADACFSLTVSPVDGEGRSLSHADTLGPAVRSVDELDSLAELSARVAIGSVAVASALRCLPATRHEHARMTRDALVLAGLAGELLLLRVHGDFWDGTAQCRRSFDRTFLLAPAAADVAAETGWPLCITNDVLHVRPFAPREGGRRELEKQ